MSLPPIVVSELFSDSVRVVRANARTYFTIAGLLVGLPTVLLQVVTFTTSQSLLAFADPSSAPDPATLLERALPAFIALIVGFTILSITYIVAQLALTKATLDALEHREVSLRTAFAVPARSYLSIFVATSVVWTAVSVGLLFCCVPAIPIAALLLFAPATIVDRGTHGFRSLAESGSIASERFTESVIVTLALLGFMLGLSMITQLLLSPFTPGLSEMLASGGVPKIPRPSVPVLIAATILNVGAYMLDTIVFQVLPTVLYVRHVRGPSLPNADELERTFA